MRGLDVFRWLMPAALAVFLSVPVQTVNAQGMRGGGGRIGGGMGGGHMGGMGGRGRPMMGSRPMMRSRFFSGNGMRSFAQRRNPTFGNRFVNRGDRFFDRRDQFRDGSFDRGGRFGNERFGREGRFEREERFENEEREEHEFFFRHNFFVAFDFGAFGFWPWWWWGWPGWWDGGYPYYGYYPYYSDPPTNGYQYGAANGSQYGADYWNNLAVSVQTKLADQGYYHGQVDGVIGSGTMEAVRRFQADHGLKVTGKIDPGLLDALGIS